MNNPFYPNTVFDNSLKTCSSGACSPKQNNAQQKMPHSFEARMFYPHSHAQQESPHASQRQPQSVNQNHSHNHQQQNYTHSHQHNHQQQNYSQHHSQQNHSHNYSQQNEARNQSYSPQNYTYQPREPYDYNAYMQAINYNHQQNANSQNNAPTDYPQAPMQKNMFGSLNPQQLMSMITNKNSFSGILSGLGASNPQLSMLMNLMQNAPKSRKASQEKKPEEIIIEDEESKKQTPYKSVKDFYKEH